MKRVSWCAVAAAMLAVQGGCEKQARGPQTITFMSAATDLPANYRVEKTDVLPQTISVEEFKARGISTDVMANANDVVGKILRTPVKAKDGFVLGHFFPTSQPQRHIVMWLEPNLPTAANNLRNGLLHMAAMTRQEYGCLGYEVYQLGTDEQPTLLVLQRWHHKEDFNAHLAGPNWKEIWATRVEPFIKKKFIMNDAKVLE